MSAFATPTEPERNLARIEIGPVFIDVPDEPSDPLRVGLEIRVRHGPVVADYPSKWCRTSSPRGESLGAVERSVRGSRDRRSATPAIRLIVRRARFRSLSQTGTPGLTDPSRIGAAAQVGRLIRLPNLSNCSMFLGDVNSQRIL